MGGKGTDGLIERAVLCQPELCLCVAIERGREGCQCGQGSKEDFPV